MEIYFTFHQAHYLMKKKISQVMFSGNFKSYFDVTKWLYLVCELFTYFLFLFFISLPINTIILFIQTAS